MIDVLTLLAPSLAACVVLAGMHAYLGIHILDRGVIFVDLALAQLAALGATAGYLAGFDLHSTGCYVASLSFALLGAGLLAGLRQHRSKVPLEAFIGIIYAVSSAGAIVVLSQTPDGGEELRNLLVGHLLFLRWPEILQVAFLYTLVGLLHWKLRGPFFQITANPARAAQSGIAVTAHDFVFYASFALVVTSSVEMAGVLLVFCFLVAPAIVATLTTDRVRGRLFIGWAVGVLASVVGLLLSYQADLPTGATVVLVLGLVVGLVVGYRALTSCKEG